MAALILTFIAEKESRNVVKGVADVAGILNVVIRILNLQLLCLETDLLTIAFRNELELFSTIWALSG